MSDKKPIRLMIVDDHMLVRDGLNLLVSTFDDLEVVAVADNGLRAVELCQETQPDVILMDLMMPIMDGPTATTKILENFPDVKILALTSFVEQDLIRQALESGAKGYLLKNMSADELADSIRAAYRGRSTLASDALQVFVQSANQPSPLGHDLTNQERKVLALLVDGLTNKEIAKELTLSPATVRVYVSNILHKLGVGNRTEAAMIAVQNRLVSLPHR